VPTPPPPSKSPPQESVKPKAEVQKEAHDAHDVENPGPPVTLDYMPVPFQKYQTVYKELQKKFNFYLVVGVGLLGLSLAIAIKEDMFAIEALRPPASYRNRKKAYMSTEKDEKSEPSPPPPAETADEKSEPSPPPPVETTEPEPQPEPQVEKTVVATEPEAPQVVAEPPAEEPKVNVAIPIVSGNLHEKTSKDEHTRTDT
ncbi:unnamed protein product, partial [Anisakis simplex]|uniref:Deltameth_res domain-containing protein n=1 Tax=Anisakis simplex TaxID=6269 RepID=A0A0M3JBS0_ANISI